MSDTVLLAIIISIPPTIVAAGNFWLAIRTQKKIAVIHDDVNSKMQQLIETTKREYFAIGAKSETDKKGISE